MAEQRHTGLDPWPTADTDLRRARSIAATIAGDLAAAWFEQRRLEASWLVADHWNVIRLVAATLLERETLSGDEIAALFERETLFGDEIVALLAG